MERCAQLQYTRNSRANHGRIGAGPRQRHAVRLAGKAIVVPGLHGVLVLDHHAARHDGARQARVEITGNPAERQLGRDDGEQRREHGVRLDDGDDVGVILDAVGGRIAAAVQRVVAILDLQMAAAAHVAGLQAIDDVLNVPTE
jgi:hypothetical protein